MWGGNQGKYHEGEGGGAGPPGSLLGAAKAREGGWDRAILKARGGARATWCPSPQRSKGEGGKGGGGGRATFSFSTQQRREGGGGGHGHSQGEGGGGPPGAMLSAAKARGGWGGRAWCPSRPALKQGKHLCPPPHLATQHVLEQVCDLAAPVRDDPRLLLPRLLVVPQGLQAAAEVHQRRVD